MRDWGVARGQDGRSTAERRPTPRPEPRGGEPHHAEDAAQTEEAACGVDRADDPGLVAAEGNAEPRQVMMEKPDERKEDAQQRREPRGAPLERGDPQSDLVRRLVEGDRLPAAVGRPPEPPGRGGPGHFQAGGDRGVARLPHKAEEPAVIVPLRARRSHATHPA